MERMIHVIDPKALDEGWANHESDESHEWSRGLMVARALEEGLGSSSGRWPWDVFWVGPVVQPAGLG